MYRRRLINIVVCIVLLILSTCGLSGIFANTSGDVVKIDGYYDNVKQDVQTYLEKQHGLLSISSSTLTASDVLITHSDENNIPEKFKGYNKVLLGYSPVITVVPDSFIEEPDKYISTLTNSNGSVVYKKYMIEIIEALSDLDDRSDGIASNKLKIGGDKSYRVIIPGGESVHSKAVVDTFIGCLLNGKQATKSNITEIQDTLNNVLKNAYKTLNVNDVIKNIDNSEYIIIFPEHMLNEMYVVGSKVPVNIIYSDDSYSEQLYMYYPDDISEYIDDFLVSLSEPSFLNHTLTYETGYRVDGLKFSNREQSYRSAIDLFNNNSADSSINKALGKSYWKILVESSDKENTAKNID